jgi:hypothetical protein
LAIRDIEVKFGSFGKSLPQMLDAPIKSMSAQNALRKVDARFGAIN